MDKNQFISAFHTVSIDPNAKKSLKFFKVLGPSFLIAVGYMDPGNWATDLAGGSQFGYLLISVLLMASCVGIFFQHLCIKLGVATGHDLATNCRMHFSKSVNITLWVLCQLAIISCDVAEVLGTAIALQLLFHIPILIGSIITIIDVLVILFCIKKNFTVIESIIVGLISIIAVCFFINVFVSVTHYQDLFQNLIPSKKIFTDQYALYIAIGILGATVMPHNLYLHSSIVNTRSLGSSASLENKKQLIQYSSTTSGTSLFLAFFVNAAILILAANTFFYTGKGSVDDISKAYHLISPILGFPIAGFLFAIALLAAGQSSSITGTLAGQIVMEGFLNLKMPPTINKIITRVLAIVPVIFFILIYGSNNISKLMILSQVVLSFQLPFAIIPLIIFTNSQKKMGELKNNFLLKMIGILLSIIIVILNIYLIINPS